MVIEVLLTEAEVAQEFFEAIEARDLPEKFFYWVPLSVKAAEEASRSATESLTPTWDALALRAAELVKSFPGRVPVISLGAGDGSKDRRILKALVDAGREVKYFPVDASQIMLETACAAAEDEDCEALGIKADISSPMHLMLAADVSEAPRLFLMVGNTLGGFDPLDQTRQVAGALKKGDLLILDAEIAGVGDESSIDSDAERRFVFAPLASVGLALEDGELKFSESDDDRRPGLRIVTRKFQPSSDLRMVVNGREITVERGERILLNFRYRFTREALRWLVTDHAGLKVMAEIPAGDGRFVTIICSK